MNKFVINIFLVLVLVIATNAIARTDATMKSYGLDIASDTRLGKVTHTKFKGKSSNPCEVAFVKLLNGKIPAEAKGNPALNMWDERFNSEQLLADIRALKEKPARIKFVEDLTNLVYKDQHYVDNLSDVINLMSKEKLIGYDDINRIFLKKTFNENTKKFSDIEEVLKKEESDLLAKKATLNKEEYKEKMNSLRKRSIDYQSQRRAAIDKITTQRAKARETLINKIDPILKVYIKENDISLVADRKFILGGHPDYDITKIIVEKLNKEFPSLNLK